MPASTNAPEFDDAITEGKRCDRSECGEQATEALKAAKPQGGTMTFYLCESCHAEVAP